METIHEKAFALLQRCEVITVATLDEKVSRAPFRSSKYAPKNRLRSGSPPAPGSDKTAHLRRNPRAGISFFDRGDSVALTGTAEVIEYPAVKKIMWQEWFIKHFPGGVEDPEYCLVRFEARKGVFYIEDKFVKSVLK